MEEERIVCSTTMEESVHTMSSEISLSVELQLVNGIINSIRVKESVMIGNNRFFILPGYIVPCYRILKRLAYELLEFEPSVRNINYEHTIQ